MIYTVTFNPALDYVVEVDKLILGATNRTFYEQMLPGGKGVNVSVVLNNLGVKTTALGFLAGFVGEEIERLVAGSGVTTEFIRLSRGCSRINMKVRNMDGTEINGMGPEIPKEKIEELMERLDCLTEKDVLVLAGSIPDSLPSTIYMDIMKRLEKKSVTIVVDAVKDLLRNVLPYRPFLIKPNHHELGDLFGVTLNSREEVIPYAKELQKLGARNVLVSLGGQGAVLLDEYGKVHESEAPEGRVVNAVGAGDSMVAGFIAGFLESEDYAHAFRMGLAAGSASAFSETLAGKAEIDRVYRDSF